MPHPPAYKPLAGNEDEMSSRTAGKPQFLDPAVPALRIITIDAAILGTILAPIAAVGTHFRRNIYFITLIPLLLSGFLAVFLLISSRRPRQHALPEFVRIRICIVLDLFLALLHIALFIATNIEMSHNRVQKSSGQVLCTWVTVFLMVDILCHFLLLLNALPKLQRIRGIDGQQCPRCGFGCGEAKDTGIINEVLDQLIAADTDGDRKGCRGMMGNLVEESDFEDAMSSTRPSGETL